MIVSLSKKFIFVHNPKAAGSSISSALKPWQDKAAAHWTKHETNTEFLVRTGIDVSEFFVFGFVRNPWDRFYSFFKYMKRKKLTDLETVNDMALALEAGDSNLIYRHSVRPQYEYFDADTQVFMYENLPESFNAIARHLDLEPRPKLEVLNATPSSPYYEMYNQEGEDIIEKRYWADIEAWGYTYEGSYL